MNLLIGVALGRLSLFLSLNKVLVLFLELFGALRRNRTIHLGRPWQHRRSVDGKFGSTR